MLDDHQYNVEFYITKASVQCSFPMCLKREGMDNANPVSMLMDLNIKIQPNPDGNEGSRSNYYAKLLGELQFLTNSTRPDIAYAINKLAAYTTNPSLQHVGALKQLLRYLKGMKNLGIIYSATSQNELQESNILFCGYADAAYANMDDYKSNYNCFIIYRSGIYCIIRGRTRSMLASELIPRAQIHPKVP